MEADGVPNHQRILGAVSLVVAPACVLKVPSLVVNSIQVSPPYSDSRLLLLLLMAHSNQAVALLVALL